METQENQFAEYRQYIETYRPKIEDALRENLPLAPTHIESQFDAALEYYLFSDKEDHLNPILTLLSGELFGSKTEDLLPSSVAVEFIQKSSDIFEDLLTKNILRNEQETLHEKFNDEIAILVGLSFLNSAYPLVFVNHTGTPERAFAAHAEIVECVSGAGLIGGQFITDLEDENSGKILKKSAILRLAVRLGAILSGVTYLELASISRFAEILGDSFQTDENSNERDSKADEAKRILIENFPSNEARSCMIQLLENLTDEIGLK